MDQSLEVTNTKTVPTESTLSEQVEIPTEMKLHSIKQESDYLAQSEIYIKTELQEDQNEFPVIASTPYDMWLNYDKKNEIDEPVVKIEYEDFIGEIMQDPLDVDSEIQGSCEDMSSIDVRFDKGKSMINTKYGSLENDKMQDPLEGTSKMKVKVHFLINWEQGEPIKTEPTEEDKEENLLESDEDTESHRSTLNFQQLITNDPVCKDKKYVCNECNKTFRQKSELDRHLRIHTGVKPYICNVCKKSFTQKPHLDGHMLIHSGEKPYSCDLCKKGFSQKSNLNSHKLTHSGLKQFLCDVCKKLFARKQDLVRHQRIHIGKKLLPEMRAKKYSRKNVAD